MLVLDKQEGCSITQYTKYCHKELLALIWNPVYRITPFSNAVSLLLRA